AARRSPALAGGGRGRSPAHPNVHLGTGRARVRARTGGRGTSPAMTQSSAPATLAVVIVSYRARQLLAECLDSLFAHPPAMPWEAVVVEHASDDGRGGVARGRYSS